MLSDIEIAQQAKLRPITEIAAKLSLSEDDIELYGKYKAKVSNAVYDRLKDKPSGKLIYTTAITATPAGEGKTVTTIGLTQALGRLGRNVAACIREPSLGPTFGIKGGAAGGGYSQVVPMEDINLHFTGDIHAVTTAHNLLAAMLDNHIAQGNALNIDPKRIVLRRVLDINDRQLRNIVIGLGGLGDGYVREAGFDISVASEIMAILCLASDLQDLKERVGRMLVAYTYDRKPVYARDLKAEGAIAVIMKDAIKPNLVQTLEGQPVFIHGGPFANIAHGNNSIIATRLALKLADYVVTEGGFASDLGAEKFFDIVHGYSGLKPDVAVLVVSVRALNMHGGVPKEEVQVTNLEALRKGLANLDKHVENLKKFGLPIVVAINQFPTDTPEELELVRQHCAELGVRSAISQVVAKGGAGGEELAKTVLEVLESEPAQFEPLYDWKLPIKSKLEILAKEIYGADDVVYTPKAERSIRDLTKLGYGELPVCVAKTQHSISDNPKLKGVPKGWKLTITDVRPSLGAGFLVCLAGDIMTMPGLPAKPAAENVDIDAEGRITGLF
ncbi:MAG: formate--tetrahydrofolate ligase [Limnochordia bacterium]|mgnify:FL=1|jgi:formate--tetrahydrofolate ligase|nr:formate--tetrahydrofolate ligase [Bacillota bacterium]HAN94299.1 formate--tetrahydrofolate ligase [Bacillota bacterium]HOQ73671.1 formate--tetrahydrofolate ligase [Limnochordia bacterium]HPU65031.1 formate--tetrahydrofolate ligase [Limnochordia bacterium]